MAEITKILNTKIALRTRTYAEWTGDHAGDILLKGEIGICEIPTGNAAATTAPTVLFKVGDGTLPYYNADPTKCLKWASALAADVYAWAKKENPDWNDFPALPLEVVDNGTGKFVTDFTYANNKLTITRADVAWTDITGKPDVALKSDIPTEGDYGVLEVKGDDASGVEIDTTDAQRPIVKIKANTYDAHGAANDVKTGIENGTIKAKAATHADAATKVDNALTVKVGGEDVIYDGSEAKTADVDAAIAAAEKRAKDYADEKPHENTAHTHKVGDGLKQSANGGITGEVLTELNLAFVDDSENKLLKLVDATDNTKVIASFDTTEFIADGMLASVTPDVANNKLVFEWNTTAGITKTEIELDKIADIYTAAAGATEVQIAISNENVVSAINGKNIIKEIYVKGKLVNIVAK